MATTAGHLAPISLALLLFISSSSHAASSLQSKATVVVGTVYCGTCFHYNINLITGAVVAVECHSTVDKDRVFRKEVKTSMDGVFRVHLEGGGGVKVCSVKLLRSSHPFCSVGEASSNSYSSLRRLKKLGEDGVHVYSAGFFIFRPIKQPDICDHKLPFMPPNPFQPPSLFPPPPLFPPNPFQPPPPPLFPPNPFQPPPPPLFPPNPFQPPPPPPFFRIPKIPGLAPPSPPPPPPFFHIPKIPGFFSPPPPPPPPFFHIPKIPGFFSPPRPPRCVPLYASHMKSTAP